MNYKKLSRTVTAVILVAAVAASLWFTSPVRALEIEINRPSSGTLGSTYSFSVNVSIEDDELLHELSF